jgi:hypothetical protein
MYSRYDVNRADEEFEMLSEVMLRVMLDEREREAQERLRVQQLLGGRQGSTRRVHVTTKPPSRQTEGQAR